MCVRIYNIVVGTDDGRRDLYLFSGGVGPTAHLTSLLLAAVPSLSF